VVVGNYAAGSDPSPSGFYYSGGTCYTINGMTDPEAINGNTVVGANDNGSALDAAVYTLGNSNATYIGSFAGATQSIAYSVSTSGTVVGFSGNDAFVYSNGTLSDLNTLVQGGLGAFSDLSCAYGISPNGEYIVGDGTTSTGYTQAFLLTAVATPEPSTLLLAAGGLVGLLAYAWRKRK
jgi:probable HAF family extracellular repeat protein